ncbi:FMN-binding negative transcriptional regulator [Sutcliffiella rhizosphaerae]|uniref:Protease synthase and sporulation protein PAI 2 n=1 Tax=Sutcliffiella rhizosphaerae TaxID=2880967 RepID=A0ABM8YQY8_9BACI|nr:FMN-binding negative transcriptional regulator [Sutcliffiella rhizosphaerae]CAG9622409.1 Protease synthase and sporulation protein PAI 2 [Sutcliffiella rhizosphaerae]
MYIPSHFIMEDEDKLYNVIQEYGFATLISQHEGAPFATHLPLMMDENKEYLYGHFAKANPQWQSILNQNVLATFQGPHCYISPSWYESFNNVPTWNYIAVHVYGKVELVNESELQNSLFDLVNKYEASDSPYDLNKVDKKYLEGLSKGVVGFRIRIEKMEGKAKLSQNHSQERRNGVIRELEKIKVENDEQKIALLMKGELL